MAENIINRNLQNIQDPDTEMNQMIPEANNFAFDIGSRVAPLGTFFAGTDYRSSNMDKNIMDIISNQGTQKGTIGYQDYDPKQPSNTAFPDLDGMMSRYLSGEISPSQFGNATQTGRMNYNLDPDTGQYNFTGNKYDFRPDVADQGGIFGYFANKANERGMNINPGSSTKAGYLSDYEAGEHYNMTPEPADAISRPNVQSQNYNMDQSFYMNPNSVEQPQNMFQRAGSAVKGGLESLRNKVGSIAEFMPFIGDKSLTGMAMRGAGKVAKGIGNFFQGNPEQRARNEYNKQFSTGDTYGYGMGSASSANKDAFGYNTVSYGGNYKEHMIDAVEKLEELLTRTNRKGFKPGTYNFNKLNTYKKSINKIQQDNIVKKQKAALAFEQEKLANTAFQNAMAQGQGFYDQFGKGDAASTASREQAGAGYDSVEQGSPFADGGLASMFVRRR